MASLPPSLPRAHTHTHTQTAEFHHYEDGAMRQLQDLLGLNSSFSLREQPSIKVFSSQEVTGTDLKWEEVERK